MNKNKKKFTVNSTIMLWECKNVYFVNLAENNKKLINLICEVNTCYYTVYVLSENPHMHYKQWKKEDIFAFSKQVLKFYCQSSSFFLLK